MLRITAYAEKLLADLDTIDWTDSLKEMQRNWIGRSEGSEVDFQIADCQLPIADSKIRVFTTAPGHFVRRNLFGACARTLARGRNYQARTMAYHAKTMAGGQRISGTTVRAKATLERTELRQGKIRRVHRRLRHQSGERRKDSDLDRRLRSRELRHRRNHGRAGA